MIWADIDWDASDVRDLITDMDDRSGEFKPVFRAMRDVLQDHWAGNFTKNGLPVGGWAPLSAEYGAWKSVHIPGAPPMIRSGRLFKSLRDLRGSPNEINRQVAQFGTPIKYAKFHQYGTTKMPKREIIYEPKGFSDEWAERAAEYVADGKAGL